MAGSGIRTDNRPLSLSFRLNPWPFSQALTHLQVWNGQHGSEEVASGLWASHFLDRTLTFSPQFYPSIWVRDFRGIQFSLLISQLCLHFSDVIDRHLNMLTLTFWLSWSCMQLLWSEWNISTLLWGFINICTASHSSFSNSVYKKTLPWKKGHVQQDMNDLSVFCQIYWYQQ